MQTFIEEIVQQVLDDHRDHLDRLTVVFPNRRAGLFFKKALAAQIDQPIWMPRVMSMEDFVLHYASLQKSETIESVFLLHEAYKKIHQKEEPFDTFYFWGEMILKDFEEVDHYLVEADQLFTSIRTQKELDEEFYFLDEEEMKIIRSFWLTFLPEATKTQEAFLETWKILKPVYHAFKSVLHARGQGYGGMIYRQFLEELKNGKVVIDRTLLFAGFNALTPAEEGIIGYCVRELQATLIWDTDAYYMDDNNQEAGYFLRGYRKSTLLGPTFPEKLPARISQPREITLTGVSLETGQTLALAEELTRLASTPGFRPEQTVIVLPHEYMLMPVLHSLPEVIDQVNITMGYPLRDTPVYGLLESALYLQTSLREHLVHGVSFYHKPVLELLEHPLLLPVHDKGRVEAIRMLKKRNLIYLYKSDLPVSTPLLTILFSKADRPLDYLLEIVTVLREQLADSGHDMELEFAHRFYQHLQQLKRMTDGKSAFGFDFMTRLFRRMAGSLKVPFTGEPLGGIQVMGVLETRNLDFENVFILNMNEDAWPAAPRRGSFVPYNIRKAFELPVLEHQDAIYAYLFYRLLQRSRHVFMYYNTVSAFHVNGELSRFVRQLEVESSFVFHKKILSNPIQVAMPRTISIPKTAGVLKRLDRFTTGFTGKFMSRLTPSALDTYLHCRLRFYFRYVEELYEPDLLQEEMDPMVFGNILHDTMEILYGQFMKKQKRDILVPDDFLWLENGVEGAMNQAFIQHYQVRNVKKFELEGRNIVAAEVIGKMVRQILRIDQKYAPFRILGLEASTRDGYSLDYPVAVGGRNLVVGLKGKIDRLDQKGGKIRVVDYKTGKDEKVFANVPSLIDRESDKRNKAAFQVFFYSYLFLNAYRGPFDQLEPALYNSRNLFDRDFSWQLIQKEGKDDPVPVTEFRHYLDGFEAILSGLLGEIWDESVPFDQVEDDNKCSYCPYKGICGRS